VGDLKNNIKKIRKIENISQKQLAKHLKVTQQAVSYMENTEANISIKRMKKISKFLKRDLVEVFPELKQTEVGSN
jgi:transcriptional regulator with XRE-family HTH domain